MKPAAPGPAFDLSGGDLALDFANTVSERRSAGPIERLGSYGDLVEWAAQAGVLDAARRRELGERARRHPREAESVRRRAARLREAIFAVAAALGERRPPAAAAVAELDRAVRPLLARTRLVADGAGVRTELARVGAGLDEMLPPVARAAVDLLTGPAAGRIRVCAGERCAWLFLDRSRAGTRRWCDMTVCGNRAKAKRHYARERAPAPSLSAPRRTLR